MSIYDEIYLYVTFFNHCIVKHRKALQYLFINDQLLNSVNTHS